jgi:hypothetical protein
MLYARAGGYSGARAFALFQLLCPPAWRENFWRRIAGRVLAEAFAEGERGVVVFDWITSRSTLPIDFVREVIEQARSRGHTSVSLPHGDSPHINELIRNHELRPEPQTKYASSAMFDYVVCPNELCAKRYRPYLPEDRIQVLGSARYSDEWLQVLPDILPPTRLNKPEGTLCIAMFLRKKEFSLFWDEIERVIRMLGRFEGIHLIIKPHTRDYRRGSLKQILKRNRSPRIEVAGDELHSASLLLWADVIIDISTSVAYEAVKRGIPVLAADYLHAGYSALAHYVPETAIHYRDQIYNAILSLRDNPGKSFYNEQHRQTFIQTMIDVPDENVLDRYVKLLASGPEFEQAASIAAQG